VGYRTFLSAFDARRQNGASERSKQQGATSTGEDRKTIVRCYQRMYLEVYQLKRKKGDESVIALLEDAD
jgi:hypothetical protein